MAYLEYTKNQAGFIVEGLPEIDGLRRALSFLRLPICEGYAGGKKNFRVNQKILNAMIRNRLRKLGWEVGRIPLAPKDRGLKIGNKGDFKRELENGLRIFGEVEFGNSASVFRDFFKFGFVRDIDTFDIGILVVPSDNFSKEVENILSYQDVKRILEHVSGSIQTPILVLGIHPSRSLDIDCYELEPNYTTQDWKNTSEPDWDGFVTKHEDSLFIDDGRYVVCPFCGEDMDIPPFYHCKSIGCIDDDGSEETWPGILDSYVNTLVHSDEGQGEDVFGNALDLGEDEIDDIFDEGVNKGVCSAEEAEATKDRLRRFNGQGNS